MRVVSTGLDKAERTCISWEIALENLQGLGELTVLTIPCGPDLKRPGHVPTAQAAGCPQTTWGSPGPSQRVSWCGLAPMDAASALRLQQEGLN